MRKVFIILTVFICSRTLGQNVPKADSSLIITPVKSISIFIDSLREKILSDTLKFNQADVAITKMGIVNIHSYSPLFFINILYQYKLDIIHANMVYDFANEILVPKKIKSISLLSKDQAIKTFGTNGENGVIIIEMKTDAKVNFNVAGFKLKGSTGNKFSN